MEFPAFTRNLEHVTCGPRKRTIGDVHLHMKHLMGTPDHQAPEYKRKISGPPLPRSHPFAKVFGDIFIVGSAPGSFEPRGDISCTEDIYEALVASATGRRGSRIGIAREHAYDWVKAKSPVGSVDPWINAGVLLDADPAYVTMGATPCVPFKFFERFYVQYDERPDELHTLKGDTYGVIWKILPWEPRAPTRTLPRPKALLGALQKGHGHGEFPHFPNTPVPLLVHGAWTGPSGEQLGLVDTQVEIPRGFTVVLYRVSPYDNFCCAKGNMEAGVDFIRRTHNARGPGETMANMTKATHRINEHIRTVLNTHDCDGTGTSHCSHCTPDSLIYLDKVDQGQSPGPRRVALPRYALNAEYTDKSQGVRTLGRGRLLLHLVQRYVPLCAAFSVPVTADLNLKSSYVSVTMPGDGEKVTLCGKTLVIGKDIFARMKIGPTTSQIIQVIFICTQPVHTRLGPLTAHMSMFFLRRPTSNGSVLLTVRPDVHVAVEESELYTWHDTNERRDMINPLDRCIITLAILMYMDTYAGDFTRMISNSTYMFVPGDTENVPPAEHVEVAQQVATGCLSLLQELMPSCEFQVTMGDKKKTIYSPESLSHRGVGVPAGCFLGEKMVCAAEKGARRTLTSVPRRVREVRYEHHNLPRNREGVQVLEEDIKHHHEYIMEQDQGESGGTYCRCCRKAVNSKFFPKKKKKGGAQCVFCVMRYGDTLCPLCCQCIDGGLRPTRFITHLFSTRCGCRGTGEGQSLVDIQGLKTQGLIHVAKEVVRFLTSIHPPHVPQ